MRSQQRAARLSAKGAPSAARTFPNSCHTRKQTHTSCSMKFHMTVHFPTQHNTMCADATVCPIAIKYNKIFVDAFWNSKRQSFSAHLVRAVLACGVQLAASGGAELAATKPRCWHCGTTSIGNNRPSPRTWSASTVVRWPLAGYREPQVARLLDPACVCCSWPPLTRRTLHPSQVKLMCSWALVCDVWFLEPQASCSACSSIPSASWDPLFQLRTRLQARLLGAAQRPMGRSNPP